MSCEIEGHIFIMIHLTADKGILNCWYTLFVANLNRILFVELGIGLGGPYGPSRNRAQLIRIFFRIRVVSPI